MARTLSAAAQAEIANKLGTEPINIVQVEWIDGTVTQYADKDIIENNLTLIPGKVLAISNLDEILNLSGSSSSISVNVRLDDSDGSIKTLMDQYDIHKRPCKVLQYFDGLDLDDAFLLFDGEVSSPITWSAQEKEVTFDVLSAINAIEVGFSPEAGQFQYVNDSLVGKNWPLVFGSCIHVPAQKAQETLVGQSMNLFGLIDATLAIKFNTLTKVANKLVQEYSYLKTVLDLVGELSTPLQLQQQYIDLILDEDEAKQTFEDMGIEYEGIEKRIDRLKKRWELATTKAEKNDIKNHIGNLDEQLVTRQSDRQQIGHDLERFHKQKFIVEYQGDLYQYLFEIGNEVKDFMREIIQEHTNIQDQIRQINIASLEQAALLTRQIVVSNGEEFPQNTNLNILVNNVNLRGFFTGKIFNIAAVFPTNSNVTLTTPQSAELDALWLTDPNLKLEGQYCLMNTGQIIKITSQEDSKCKFSLVKKRGVETFTREDELILNTENSDEIRSAMQNYLDGSETDEELQAIANRAPKDLPRSIWKQLSGNKEAQKLKLIGDCDGGYFTLIYDEWETGHIPFDADIARIRLELEALPPFVSFVNTDKWEFEGGPINESEVTITFNTAKWTDDDDPIPKLMLPLFAKSDFLQFVGFFNTERVPYIVAYRETEGAQEYTLLERANLLESALEEDPDYEKYGEAKKLTQKTLNAYWLSAYNGGSAQEKQKLAQAVFVNFDKMLALQKAASDSVLSTYDEANKLISDSEYQFLYQMELANYFRMIRRLSDLSDELDGDNDEEYYFTNLDFTRIMETAPVMLPQWLAAVEFGTDNEVIEKVMLLPESSSFVAQIGSELKLNALNQEKYVANILPSAIHAVYAKRNIEGTQRLVPVSTSKYTKIENHDHGFLTTTTIILTKPLSDYPAENWSGDDLYVTLTSSVGPLITDIITWILETFTDISVDATSFAQVAAQVSDYPANFALFDKKDAISLVKDIAWQSRCSLWIKNKVAYIRYLSIDPTSVATLTDSDIEEDSLILEHTETEDIVTKFTAKWKTDYFRREDIQTIIRHNLSRYGEHIGEYDFFIYNIGSLVLKSATFWAYRYANTWKRIKLTTFLNHLKIETFDCVTIDLTDDYFSTGPIDGIVEKAEYDSQGNNIRLTVWLPVKAGEMIKSDFAFPGSVSIDTTFPEDEVIFAGNAGNPVTQQVPSGLTVNPLAGDFTDKRPPDFGEYKPSDAFFEVPTNPTDHFAEITALEATKKTTQPVSKKAFIQNYNIKNKGQINPLKKDFTVKKNIALGLQPNFTGTATIIEKNTEKSVPIDADPEIEDSDDEHQYYNVRLSNGEVVIAKVMQIDKDDTLPKGMKVMVVYDTHLKEYQTLVPVAIGDDIEEV